MRPLIEIFHDVETKIHNELHNAFGKCGHCGKRDCEGRKNNSVLPNKLVTRIVLAIVQDAMVKQMNEEQLDKCKNVQDY